MPRAQAAREEQNRPGRRVLERVPRRKSLACFKTEITPTLNTMTQSQAYKDMVEFTTGDGVRKAKIDYYTPGALTSSVTEEWCGDDQDL